MYDSITRRHVSIGAAIERAAKDLPDGYTMMVELERGAGTVTLFMPPASDDEPGRTVDDFLGDGFEDFLNNAIEMAIEHAEEVGDGETAKTMEAAREMNEAWWRDPDQ